MTLSRIDAHGLSVGGLRHAENHDQFAIAELRKTMRLHQSSLPDEDEARVQGGIQGRVFLVADGMGGEPASARASRAAVRGVVEYLVGDMPWSDLAVSRPEAVLAALEDATRCAQEELERARRPDDAGMGTTLTIAFVAWPHLFVTHVGDSRCYLRRGNELFRLTTDHTLAELRESVGGNAEGADSNVLWNAVGGRNADLHPEVRHFELEPRDVLVLVTDGVVAEHTAKSFQDAVDSDRTAAEMCAALVSGRGGDDQTAVAVRFLPEEPFEAGLTESRAADVGTAQDAPRGTPRPPRASRPAGGAGVARPLALSQAPQSPEP